MEKRKVNIRKNWETTGMTITSHAMTVLLDFSLVCIPLEFSRCLWNVSSPSCFDDTWLYKSAFCNFMSLLILWDNFMSKTWKCFLKKKIGRKKENTAGNKEIIFEGPPGSKSWVMFSASPCCSFCSQSSVFFLCQDRTFKLFPHQSPCWAQGTSRITSSMSVLSQYSVD